MKEIINNNTYLFIEIPANALHNKWFIVWNEKNSTFNVEFQTNNESIYTPLNIQNDCYILSTTKDITEEQAESIVEHYEMKPTDFQNDNYLMYKCYLQNIDNELHTAKESLQSLIQANGLDVNKTYLIVKKNNMIENNFVPYELALELKNLGFDESCFAYWKNNKIIQYSPKKSITQKVIFDNYQGIKAPLYQEVLKWFRDKYNLFSLVYPVKTEEKTIMFDWDIYDDNCEEDIIYEIPLSNTYEEAQLECLKQLILIVKKNKLI